MTMLEIADMYRTIKSVYGKYQQIKEAYSEQATKPRKKLT